MKGSTVSIVMAILCSLSSWRSAEGDNTIAIAVNCNPSDAACSNAPSNAGSSSGSNDKDKENKLKEELEKALKEKYEGQKKEDLDKAINALISSIQQALAKYGLSGAMTVELNFALKILMKALGNPDTSFKQTCYNEALNILIIILGGKEDSDKIEPTTMSYAQWKAEEERKLDEKYGGLKSGDVDRDISALMKSIQQALQIGLCAPKVAELNYAMKILIKAIGYHDSSVKRPAYNDALHLFTEAMKV